MASIGGILSTAAQALVTHQKALAVTAHNVSNAQTEGYSRQRAVLRATTPLMTPDGMVGRGVELAEIDRVRDPLLDAVYRRESSSTAFHGERADQLTGIEKVFGEPSETGLLTALDAFWNSWGDLATEPLNDAARSVVRERAIALGDRFSQLVSGLQQQRAGGDIRVRRLIDRANELTAHVADLNGRIVAGEAAGGEAGDLRDARDIALDELSTLVDVQVVERDNGSVGVYLEGQGLVDGPVVRKLLPKESGGTVAGISGVVVEGRSTEIREPGGKIGGLVGVLQGELATAQTELEELALAITTKVNEIHAGGVPPSPVDPATEPEAGQFFKVGLHNGRLELADPIKADPDAIAAGAGAADGSYLAGTNDVARDLAALRETEFAIPAGGTASSIADYYSTLVTRTGSQVSAAESSSEVHETLARNADMRRTEVSGVSIDEELTHMIQQQAAYGAAAKMVSRVDEMLQTLLGIV